MLHKVKAHKLVDVEFNLNMYLVPLSRLIGQREKYPRLVYLIVDQILSLWN